MSQFPHDQFAKDLLESLLSPFGKVETDRKISGEVREIDVCFFPNADVANLPSLGLLSKLAVTGAAFEPFRNPVSADEIRSCEAKLFDLHSELNRHSKRQQQRKQDDSLLPMLWILTPTLATATLESFGAITDVEVWGNGVYLFPPGQKTGIVVIHQLPEIPDTLWLRILGKHKVQQRAVEEINRLDATSPYRQNALKLLSDLMVVLAARQDRNNRETELLMSLRTSAIYLEQIEKITREAVARARTDEARVFVLKQLTRKLGSLSPELTEKVSELSLDRLETLGEDLLDFQAVGDLENWLG
ncbi:DUF4351 domain-containing protein [Chamaesiphon polymorphus]|uniref:DUF4351 domain-containing protein n=1 Tax=Chamaesiphon polymorphus CCALA 037 TaxID=2107692 RepID=A0A2T1GM02_9CYAN|nr:DUF4351 domain-containing protein [Chamaesiphon polymorphus]PSB58922.1 hypothetical protein C7B77_02795 [Chamaesiphon polymorphus CCALA 037]